MSVRYVFQSALSVMLVASSALAQSAEDEAELVEKVAVRNRLYFVQNRFEVGANLGISLLPRLTDHWNLNLSVAYNMAEWFAAEVRGGYAISYQTRLAQDVKDSALSRASQRKIDDFSDLWQMGFNAVAGLRFQPIYGKLNLAAELPVHFQLYLWAGGGVGLFSRESVLICTTRAGSMCNEYFKENKLGPLVSLALGFRFFAHQRHAVRLEARTWSFLDSFWVGVDRTALNAGNPTAGGMLSRTAGVTTISQIDLGYSFLF